MLNSSRVVQRLVGGHLLHDQTIPFFGSNFNFPNNHRSKNSKIYFRRKSQTTTHRPYYQRFRTNPPKIVYIGGESVDDTMLLDDNKIDEELDRASAGAGKEMMIKKDDSKKTLSDQVAEGKYGLIQSELFQKDPERPGIISYSKNAEVPKDTSKNYGGLNADDIWLAEDHLLVLKGGGLNEQDRDEPWKPIDNYEAPLRPVKIPDNPKVPPPFPVQLEENGPIQFIGNNKFPFFNPQLTNESLYAGDSAQGGPNGFNPSNLPPGFRPLENSTNGNGGQYPSPIPPWLLFSNNETVSHPFLSVLPFPGNGTLSGGYPPFPPNGSDFPSGPFPPFPINGSLGDFNFTDFDEDDPRLYYPPPYSFVYKSNYSNAVPAGPLVPGIVLPPPPNFFSRLNNKQPQTTTSKPISHTHRQQLKPITRLVTTTLPPRTYYHSTTLKQVVPADNDKYGIRSRPLQTTTLAPQIDTTTQRIRPVTTLTKVVSVTPNTIQFVPKISSENNVFKTNKGNPIYYEYFDARKPNQYNPSVTNNPVEDITQLKSTSPQSYHKEIATTPTYHQQPHRRPQNTYLPVNEYDYSKYYYVTPQPEIKPNGISDNFDHQQISFKPLQSFDQEIDTIRQTLQFYKASGGPQVQNQPTRTPKAKAVYEYSYISPETTTRKPTYNIRYDSAPFKPVVQYSAPYDSSDGFKAMPPYSSTETPNQYYSSTQGYKTPKFIQITPSRERPLKIQPVQSIQQTYLPVQYYRSSTDAPTNYYAQEAQTTTSKTPWFTIEKQVVKELPQLTEEVSQPVRQPHRGYSRIRDFNSNGGYTYERPSNQYYNFNQEDQFNKQVSVIRQKLKPNQNQQYHVSLVNDTYVNYLHPRPQINPDSEYIGPQTFQPPNTNQQIVNQYYPTNNNRPSQQNQQSPSLHKDTLVNYKYPLPPINPDSEYILPQQYRKYHTQQNPVIQYRLPGDQAHVYFITPREMKYNKRK